MVSRIVDDSNRNPNLSDTREKMGTEACVNLELSQINALSLCLEPRLFVRAEALNPRVRILKILMARSTGEATYLLPRNGGARHANRVVGDK